MKIKNLGTVTFIQQKKIGEKIEKIIRVRLDLNTKVDQDEEYNIYVYVDTNSTEKDNKKAMLIPMEREMKIANDFEISLNKKYDFELDQAFESIVGLTEYSEK